MTVWVRNFLENPLVARQLATSLSAGKLAWLFLLVNATAILSAASGFALVWEQAYHRGVALPETGRVLHIFTMLGLQAAMIVLFPLRGRDSSMAHASDRRSDQLVVTGVSPLRLHFANLALGLFYAFVLLVVSFPIVCVCWTLDGLSFQIIIASYAVLLVYANVILAATLALSTLEREWLTVPTLIATLLVASFVALIPDENFMTGFPPSVQ